MPKPSLPASTPPPDPRQLWDAIAARPHTLADILDHVSTGGTVLDLALTWGVPVRLVMAWLARDPERRAAYDAVLMTQSDAWASRLRDEVNRLAQARVIGDPPLPEGAEPVLTLKPVDKLRAIELAGRDLGLFREKLDVTVNVNVAEGIKRARLRARIIDAPPSAPARHPGGGDSAGAPPAPPSLAQKYLAVTPLVS